MGSSLLGSRNGGEFIGLKVSAVVSCIARVDQMLVDYALALCLTMIMVVIERDTHRVMVAIAFHQSSLQASHHPILAPQIDIAHHPSIGYECTTQCYGLRVRRSLTQKHPGCSHVACAGEHRCCFRSEKAGRQRELRKVSEEDRLEVAYAVSQCLASSRCLFLTAVASRFTMCFEARCMAVEYRFHQRRPLERIHYKTSTRPERAPYAPSILTVSSLTPFDPASCFTSSSPPASTFVFTCGSTSLPGVQLTTTPSSSTNSQRYRLK